MVLLSKIIQALAAALPALISWWERRQAAKAQAEIEARNADIRREPAGEWLHKFNSQANPGGGANQAGADQPDGDK